MKILQINKFLYPRGGAETHLFDLAELLKSHGQDVGVFSTQSEKNITTPFNRYFIPYTEMHNQKNWLSKAKTFFNLLYSRTAAKKMEELLKDFHPDVAHLHNIYHHISPSILPVLKKHHIPVIMTLHDYKLISPNYRLFDRGQICECVKGGKFYNCIKHKCVFNEFIPSLGATIEMYVHHWLKIYENNVNLYIAPSQFLKDKMVEFGQDPKKIIVLPNFINLPSSPTPPPLGNYLLYTGRLVEEKGLITLLNAAKLMPEVEHNALFNKITLEQINNVKLLGYKTGDGWQRELDNARAYVLPSIWYENYPISLLEASVRGKITFASRVGGLPEMIKDGTDGVLFEMSNAEELANKVKSLWNDETKLKQMGEMAKKRVQEQNNPEKYYQKIMEIYNKVIKK
ncbi:MAG: glycosyltransferase family 4 protein [Candidatus Magasanikbacteria bacterium]|nr:glycosyltransferase family 4 protein [Candidatus Magasanikbacteria bacterium]